MGHVWLLNTWLTLLFLLLLSPYPAWKNPFARTVNSIADTDAATEYETACWKGGRGNPSGRARPGQCSSHNACERADGGRAERTSDRRERVLLQRNASGVTGHDPELCVHILLDTDTLTPRQLGYSPPSQPDTNSASDLHPHYIYVAGERMKRLKRCGYREQVRQTHRSEQHSWQTCGASEQSLSDSLCVSALLNQRLETILQPTMIRTSASVWLAKKTLKSKWFKWP